MQIPYARQKSRDSLLSYTVLALFVVVFGVSSPAEAIDITRAEVQNGLALVEGNKSAKDATVKWENGNVTKSTNGGTFSFFGIVPADCLGTLSDGVDTVEVAIADCKPKEVLSKTGQTTCYELASPEAPISCAGTGQDGEFQAGAARSYTVNGNGTITDNVTGLIWEVLTNAHDGSIHDFNDMYNWAGALQKVADLNTANFAGHNDWRLPNINELHTLVDYGRDQTVIDPVFDNGVDSFTNTSDVYFSSTTNTFGPATAWGVNFRGLNAATVPLAVKFQFLFVRAVRGGR